MAESRITFHPERRRAGTLSVTETHWGYIVRETGGPFDARFAEAGLRFLGLLLVFCAIGVWLLSAGLFPSDAAAVRIWLSLGLGLAGVGLCLLAGRGLTKEIQIDTTEREFRFARRNGRGQTVVRRRVPFASVESVFVRRQDGNASQFFLRLKGPGEPTQILVGAERDLNLLHGRLCRDLKSPSERVEARMQVATPRRVAVRAPIRKSA